MKSFINFIVVVYFFISIAFKHVFFKNFFFRFFDTRLYHRIFLRVDVIIERFEHFRQSVIEFNKRRSLNIFDDDDDDIHDNKMHDNNIYDDNIHNNDIHDDNIYNDDIHNDNIYDDNIYNDDINDDDDENVKYIKDSIEIFEKFQ